MSTQAMEREQDRSPDVERAAQRLARPRCPRRARRQAAARRACSRSRCSSRCCRCSLLVVVLLRVRRRRRLDRAARAARPPRPRRSCSSRFRELPGGAFGRALERIGARELPLLFAVLRGRLSFVGPRALPPGTGAGHTGPRRLMAPGLTGPGAARLRRGRGGRPARRRLRRALDAVDRRAAARRALPEASPQRVEDQLVGHGLRRRARRRAACGRLDERRRGEAHERDEEEPDALGLGLREAEHARRSRSRRRSPSPRACGRRLCSASQVIGAPRISRNAVGEPNSQYAYGRREAIPTW